MPQVQFKRVHRATAHTAIIMAIGLLAAGVVECDIKFLR